MRWAALAVVVVGASGCNPDTGSTSYGDAGIHQAPIAIISNPQTFVPASVAQDFNENLLVAEDSQPVVDVLDACSGGDDAQIPVVGAASPWSNPQIELGAEANGYLYFGTGAFYFVNMETDAITFLFDAGVSAPPVVDAGSDLDAGHEMTDAGRETTDAGTNERDAGASLQDGGTVIHAPTGPVLAWAPRQDVPGVIYADLAGVVHRVSSQGVEDLSIPAGEGSIESVAGSLDGQHVFVLTSTRGACTTIRSTPPVGTGLAVGSFGQSPCLMAIPNQAGNMLWVVGQTDGGAEVTPLQESTLKLAGPVTSVTGIVPQVLVLAVDGSAIALLGPGPTYSVALSLTSNIEQGLDTGDQGPWRLTLLAEVPSATGGLFDDSGHLYVADPSNSSIDIIQ